MVAVATGILILFLSSAFPMADSVYQDPFVSDRFHVWIAVYHPVEYAFVEIVSGFLRGMLCASIALCVSIYISDPLVVLVSPYFVSFLAVQAYRIFHVPDRYRLDKLLTGNMIIRSSVFTVWICIVVVSVIVIFLGIFFQKTVLRRLEDGRLY